MDGSCPRALQGVARPRSSRPCRLRKPSPGHRITGLTGVTTFLHIVPKGSRVWAGSGTQRRRVGRNPARQWALLPSLLNDVAVARGHCIMRSRREGTLTCPRRVPVPSAVPGAQDRRVPPSPGPCGPFPPPPAWTAPDAGSAGPGAAPPEASGRAEHARAFSWMSYNFPSFPLQNTLIKRTLLQQRIDIQKRVLFPKNVPVSLAAIVPIVKTAHGHTHVRTHVHTRSCVRTRARAGCRHPAAPSGLLSCPLLGLLGWTSPLPGRLYLGHNLRTPSSPTATPHPC